MVFEKKFFSPVLKSPTHIGFIDVKKNGSKISHLGTFKGLYDEVKILSQFFFLSKDTIVTAVYAANQCSGSGKF